MSTQKAKGEAPGAAEHTCWLASRAEILAGNVPLNSQNLCRIKL